MCKVETTELATNNQHQIVEALGDYNRYFANRYYHNLCGRDATDGECMSYYIANGGAEGHRKRVEESRQQSKKENI